jgi:hypothetical protein
MLYQDKLLESIKQQNLHGFNKISKKIINLLNENQIEGYVEKLLIRLGSELIDKEFENNDFLDFFLLFYNGLISFLSEDDKKYCRELFQLEKVLKKEKTLVPLNKVFLKNIIQLNHEIIFLLKPDYFSFARIISTRNRLQRYSKFESACEIDFKPRFQRFIKKLNENKAPLEALYTNLGINFLQLSCLAYTHEGAESAIDILSQDRNQALLKQLIDDRLEVKSLSHLLSSSYGCVNRKISTLFEKIEDFMKFRQLTGLTYSCIFNLLSKSRDLGKSMDDFNQRIDKVREIVELLKNKTESKKIKGKIKSKQIKRRGISYFLGGSSTEIGRKIDNLHQDLLVFCYMNSLMDCQSYITYKKSKVNTTNQVVYLEMIKKISQDTALNENDIKNLCLDFKASRFYLTDFNEVTDKFCAIKKSLDLTNEDMVSMLRGSGCNVKCNITRLYVFVCNEKMKVHIKRIFLESGPHFCEKIEFFIRIFLELKYFSANQWDCLSRLMYRCTPEKMAFVVGNLFDNAFGFRCVMGIYQAFTELEDHEYKQQKWALFVSYMQLPNEREALNKILIDTLVDMLKKLNKPIDQAIDQSNQSIDQSVSLMMLGFFKPTGTFELKAQTSKFGFS